MDGVVIPDNHIVTGLEDCRKTLCFYNKIREILYEFVAEEVITSATSSRVIIRKMFSAKVTMKSQDSMTGVTGGLHINDW